ncbi:MAG: hypothetical protein OEZ05_02455 [Nitrospirota bacterium]|nr:hypothetical protein [Nitrospirota bacterium]MDH5585469.1 hypothetical protein [Nitrospirota bacterium]
MAPKHHSGFSSGRTVKAKDLHYIQRTADAELLAHCRAGRPAYILHSPQMGKSSLIAHTAENLNATGHHAVLIDLSQFPLPPREEEWFDKILGILDDSLDLETDAATWCEHHQALPPDSRLMRFVTEVVLPAITSPLILFIDEIERTEMLPFREHFFTWLSTLYEARATDSNFYRLSFVVCGVATPSQLIPPGGPLVFQWSHRVVLSDFTLQEILPLAEGLSLPTDTAIEAVTWIFRWTNGHPYLTQLLCQLLEEQHRTAWLESEVDDCVQHFIHSPQGLREPNLQLVRTALTEPDLDGDSLLEPYLALLEGRRDDLHKNPSALERLRLVGVLREDDEDIAIRNPFYAEVFSTDWVKRHLAVPSQVSPAPTPQAISLPPDSPTLQTLPPPPAPQQSFVMAASLFLIGVGLLIWFLREPSSTPLPATSPQVATLSTEGPRASQTQEALTHAQEKIQQLETTIAEYQRLSNEEQGRIEAQRNQLTTQLQSQESTLSDLLTKNEALENTLLDHQQSAQQARLQFESDKAKLAGTLAAATTEREAAQLEAKTLKTALLKQAALAPSEIKELLADRKQLETQLYTANNKLTKVAQTAQELTDELAQEKLNAQSKELRLDREQAKLQTQLTTLQAELKHTKETLSRAEQQSQDQHTLAQQELARLQQTRATLQHDVTEKERLLTEHQHRLAALETQANAYQQDLQAVGETNATLTAQLHHAQQGATEKQNRATELEADLLQHQQATDAQTRALQQERDQLSQKLVKTQAALETTNNRMTTLTTQLGSTKQELEHRQVALRDIHTASTEQTNLANNQLASLMQTRSALETRLESQEEALSQAKQRIAELEGTTETTKTVSQALAASRTENQDLVAKLSAAEQQLERLQNTLKRTPPSRPHVTSPTDPEGAKIVRMLPLITTALSATSSNTLSDNAHLLWARQAFLFSLRIGGQEWAPIDHSLREGLHAAPIPLKAVGGKIHTLTFDPSGDHVIGGTSEGNLAVWSMGQPLKAPRLLTGHSAGVLSVAVSPDGQHLASGSLDSTIRLWSLSEPNIQPRLLRAHTKGVTSLAFSPDGKQLASGSQDHTIRLWDLPNDQPLPTTLGTHTGRVNAIAYTPDGKMLLSGGDDLTLRVWDLQRKDSAPTLLNGHQQSITTIAMHPSGWIVATGSRDQRIGLWNLRQALLSPTFLEGSSGRISHVQFSADGTWVASVGSDKTVRMWNWREPTQQPIQFPSQKGALEALAISPDGRTMAVGGSSQNVTLWSGTEVLAHAVCDSATENLSYEEWKRMLGGEVQYERTCQNLPLHPSFLEEGKRLAKAGSRNQAQHIFERAKQLDPFLEFDPKKEIEKLLSKKSS